MTQTACFTGFRAGTWVSEDGQDEGWRDRAKCKGQTDLFFSPHPRDVEAARLICDSCPVRFSCLDYALDHHHRIGMWGGESGRSRRLLQRLRKATEAC